MPDTLLQDTVTDGSSYASFFFFLILDHTSCCVLLERLLLQDAISEFHLSLVWTGHQSPDLSYDNHATAGPLP